jgi:hypothetical protein
MSRVASLCRKYTYFGKKNLSKATALMGKKFKIQVSLVVSPG